MSEITKEQLDSVYDERNKLVALLARLFPSGIRVDPMDDWPEEWWNVVYIDLPTGQASWHYHSRDKHLFEGLPQYQSKWDGHTTEAKYGDIVALSKAYNPLLKETPNLELGGWRIRYITTEGVTKWKFVDLEDYDELVKNLNESFTRGSEYELEPMFVEASSEDRPFWKNTPLIPKEDLHVLHDECGKPEEIFGAAPIRMARVHELIQWFVRLAKGKANSKWTREHAMELAVYALTAGPYQYVSLSEHTQKAFVEGINLSEREREMLIRIGAAQPTEEHVSAGPDSRTVTVNVSGPSGGGKSVVANILMNAMREHGIPVKELFVGAASDIQQRAPTEAKTALRSLLESGLNVKVREKHLAVRRK